MATSFVVMTWNRGGQRVTNLLASLLLHQTTPAAEVVLVGTSDNAHIAADVCQRAEAFADVTLIQRPRDALFKSWALNVGIRHTLPSSKWVACTDIDFVFGPDLVETIEVQMRPDRYLKAEPMRLPAGIDLATIFADFDALCYRATWWGPSGGPGALQVAPRGWWFRVHGYDERYADGLGGMDDDVEFRAQHSGLSIGRIPFDTGRALHQWHPASALKDTLHHLWRGKADTTVNPDGWGRL